jgi:putative endonuclease
VRPASSPLRSSALTSDVPPGAQAVGSRRAAASRRLGAAGELRAARWYEAQGFEVLDRNWRTRTGEIDLLVRRGGPGGVLVVCEVKTRSSLAFGHPAEAVTPVRQRRLRALAAEWLRANGPHRGEVRFDVAAVLPGSIEVVEAAF